jgi:DNA replication and repair protein RecF
VEFFRISKIKASNFRNLEDEIIDFSPGINCIIGENGNGKTNILEAVFMMASKKSFRKNTSFPQILSVDGEKPEILISSVFEKKDKNHFNISLKMGQEGNFWYEDNFPVKKKTSIPIVFINPFDSYSFFQTASFRRNWMDTNISQINPVYKRQLNRYQKALRFRNNLLSGKDGMIVEQLKAIDKEMAKCSKVLTDIRIQFLEEIDSTFSQTFKKIFSEEHHLQAQLQSRCLNLTEQQIYNAYRNNTEKDIERRITTYGVHKDDYALLFDGFDSIEYCSLGQQKMAYLSLLFAYIGLFRYKFNSYPIVLIDDVSGELDKQRWRKLVQYLKSQDFQVLITTANENLTRELEELAMAKKLRVLEGKVQNV